MILVISLSTPGTAIMAAKSLLSRKKLLMPNRLRSLSMSKNRVMLMGLFSSQPALKDIWSSIVRELPSIANIAGAVAQITKLIN